jgi:hypothetical protein
MRRPVPNWIKPNAPRFHALLERREGRSIFMLRRLTWEALDLAAGTHVLLTLEDLGDTPLIRAPTFLFGTARRTDQRVQLSIFRADLGDAPEVINIDTYDVWYDIRTRVNVGNLVSAASTSTGPNLDSYLDGHVFLVAQRPDDGHRRVEFPDEVVALLKKLAG